MTLNELEKLNGFEKILYYYDLDYVSEISLHEFSEWVDDIITGHASRYAESERVYIRVGDEGLVYIRFFDIKGLGSDRVNIFSTKQFKIDISFIHSYTAIGEWYYKDFLYFMNEWKDKCSYWSIFDYKFIDPFEGRSFNKIISTQIAYSNEPIYI